MNIKNVTWRLIFLRSLIVTTLLAGLNSCAIMSKKDCQQGNWQEAGYHDATRGHRKSQFKLRTKACARHDITSDQTAYLQGYTKGVKIYCTPGNAIEAGTRNHDYRGICPAELQPDFLAHYLQGLKFARRDLQIKYWQRHSDLRHARHRRLAMAEDHNKHKINRRIDALSSSLDNIRTMQLEINRKILRWQIEIQKALREPKPAAPDISALQQP